MVAGHGPDRLPGLGRLPAHGHVGRCQGLGHVRARADAGLPLGNLSSPTSDPDRKVGFGDEYGKDVWQQVPGEHRSVLRRLIVTQGDTEPASVEQQRLLGHTAPSLYDLRNLFQVNVEEGRHLWAMVYLLARIFRARRSRGGGTTARTPFRQHRQSAHPRHLQRADFRLAQLLHVHVLHGSRRKISIEVARGIQLRSARTHVPVHADGGSPSHVRRRDGHRPHRQTADARGHAGDRLGRSGERCARRARSICRPCNAI